MSSSTQSTEAYVDERLQGYGENLTKPDIAKGPTPPGNADLSE